MKHKFVSKNKTKTICTKPLIHSKRVSFEKEKRSKKRLNNQFTKKRNLIIDLKMVNHFLKWLGMTYDIS